MANGIDLRVGRQISKRINELNVTRDDVALALGITVEDLLLIEHGEKRASAENLKTLGEILDVPLSYFYEAGGGDNTLH